MKNAGVGRPVIGPPDSHPGGGLYHAFFVQSEYDDYSYFYGGWALPVTGNTCQKNDLWRHNHESTNITYELLHGDPSIRYPPPIFGGKFASDPTYTPGGRQQAHGWHIVANNIIYLFGGSEGYSGDRGDLWTFDLTINEFSWINGFSPDEPQMYAIYPTKKTCSNSSRIGTRHGHSVWLDSNDLNRLYLFGGRGRDSTGFRGGLSDLWYYDISQDEFCFMFGDTTGTHDGNYDVKGSYTALNHPPGRFGANFWTHYVSVNESELCMFGGHYSLSAVDDNSYNDIFCWSTELEMWNWLSGSSEKSQYSRYATYFSSDANPSSRTMAGSAFLLNDYLFLFGGYGFSFEKCSGYVFNDRFNCYNSLSDFWVYSHSRNQWKLISTHSKAQDMKQWDFGTSSSYDIDNNPQGRWGFFMDRTSTGMWLFRGYVSYSNGPSHTYYDSDSWEFTVPSDVYSEGAVPSCNGKPATDVSCCSGRGFCRNNLCECFWGFTGDNCDITICFNKTESQDACDISNGHHCESFNYCNCTVYDEEVNFDIDGNTCDLQFDNSEMHCISKCYEGNEKELLRMAVSGTPFEFTSDNYIGSRRKRCIFSDEVTNIIWIFGGGDEGCDTTNCDEDYFFNDMWQFNAETHAFRIHPTAGSNPGEINGNGVYTTTGTFAANIYPSARITEVSAIHEGRYVFIFGGFWINGYLGDLWMFDIQQEMWKLLNGTNDSPYLGKFPSNLPDDYGVAYPSIRIGSRRGNGIWVHEEKVFIFGGHGVGTTPSLGYYCDMWSYSLTENTWILHRGSTSSNSDGNRLFKGIYEEDLTPSGRSYFSFWKNENEPSLYIFGGLHDSGVRVPTNDLWSFSLSLENNSSSLYMWRWIGGDIIFTHGVAVSKSYHSDNWPGSRSYASSIAFPDQNDVFVYIFGGKGSALNPDVYTYDHEGNDLWEYSTNTQQWRFVMGSIHTESKGIYSSNPRYSISRSSFSPKFVAARDKIYLFNSAYYIVSWAQRLISDVWVLERPFCESDIGINWFEIIMYSLIGVCVLIVLLVVVVVVIVLFVVLFFILKKKGKKEGKNFRELKLLDSSLKRISYDSVRIVKLIGRGGQDCSIYLSDWKGQEVAMKVFKTQYFSQESNFDEFEREAKVISSLTHPNIIQFYGVCVEGKKVAIVMEYCENGDLLQYLNKHPNKLSFIEKRRILCEVSSAMEYLHDKNIIHRDLKAGNVMLNGVLKTKLIDFGLSRIFKKNDNSKDKTRRIGTKYYMAPEIITSNSYTAAVDVFSFGILMFVVLEEVFQPYGKDENVNSAIELRVANNPDYRPKIKKDSKHPDFMIKLMKECWKHVPEERPKFSEVKNDLKDDSVEEEKRKQLSEKIEKRDNLLEDIKSK